MASIEQDLQAIANARKGRDVRNSIHDAIRDINIESSHAEEVAVSAQDSAYNSANRSESYAVGGTGTREGEDTDNSKYFYEQTAILAQGFEVIDSLESTNPYHPLSAKQGNVLDGKISTINGKVGNANGIASLDSTGRIPYSQLPESAMEYKGTWNANTNTPTLVSGEGVNGDFYVVSVAGTWNGISWGVGDRALFDDITAHEWVRLPAGEVQSVNGKVGAVQLNADDIPFDKGSSPLTSNDTNSAILEVLQKAGVQVISTTMADYLAHKVDYDRSGAIINITDTGVANSAGNVSYDNTESHLLSTTAQGAIDEVKGITDDINSNLSQLLNPVPDISYQATSNMTGQQVITWLSNNVDVTKTTINTKYIIGGKIYQTYAMPNTYILGYTTTIGLNGAIVEGFNVSANRYFDGSTSVLNTVVVSTNDYIQIYY